MSKFDHIRQGLVAAIGSLILASVAVSAAVGPARAVETAPVQYAGLAIGGTANG